MLESCPDKNFEKKMWAKIAKAIERFKMIEPGDRVAIGVSGGKDSLTLLYFLHTFMKYKIIDFELVAVHVITDVSLEKADYEPAIVEEVFKKLDIPYEIPRVTLNDPKFNKKGFVDCYWCSTQKRRLMFEAADKHNCNKIAFGHHKDDIVITNLMNAFFLSNLQTMRVNHSFFNGKYHLIRPLCLVREAEIIKFSKLMELPATCNCCRVAKDGRREEATEILHQLEKQVPDIVDSLFEAFVKNNDTLVALGYKDKVAQRQAEMGCGEE